MKRKKYSLLLTVFILFMLTISCSKMMSLDMYGLHGNVKTFVEQQYEVVLVDGEWKQGKMKLGYHYKAFFDTNGNPEMRQAMDNKDSIMQKVIVKTEGNQLVEEVKYDAAGNLTGTTFFDRRVGDQQKFTDIGIDGEKKLMGKFWYKNGRVIKHSMQFFEEGKKRREQITLYEYDMKGNFKRRIDEGVIGGKSIIETYRYLEFDDQDNWTKRLNYTGAGRKKPNKISIRTYEYY
ncbi:MAG: hypothetical protein AB8B65_19690 [Kordia sp.]|uniref:hypothetical protein n=1 Tax=Kordia sp. TaxID=1965332 RepID=UPI0038582E82